MEKIVKIKIISSKDLEIIIDLNKNITFDYLLEYLSYGYPQEHFCPCFRFVDYKRTRYIEGNEKVIDLLETNKNTFYIVNPFADKICHCNESLKNNYNKSKIELIKLIDNLDEIQKNYKEIIRENLEKIGSNNNQIIINDSVNESINKKNFVDFYDVIIDIKSIIDINKGWDIKMNERGKKNYEKYNKTKNLKIGIIGNSNKGKSFLLSKISKTNLPSGTSIRTEGLSIKYPELEKYKDRKIILLDSAGLETPVLREQMPSNNINSEE
jgi:GTP-binding protein EngB required for normal cell division